MSGALLQLRALLVLRWQMARSPGVRLGLVLGALLVLWLLTEAARTGQRVDAAVLGAAVQVAPAAYLGFGLLAVLSPLAAGGGRELVPADQLVAFPVRPTAQFAGGLVLAPLDLVWIVQLVGLAALTSCLTLDGSLLRGGATTAAYVAAVTVLGRAMAWAVAGLRRSAAGRRVVTAGGAAVLAAGVLVVRDGAAGELLVGPARAVVGGVIAGGDGHLRQWSLVTGVLLAAAVLGLFLGVLACRWTLLRPGDVDEDRTTGPVRRRPVRSGPLRQLVAVDRASVWRAPALRRGGLVLAVLPGLLAAGAALPWGSVVVLPGLVAAGAALLFGINAFGLDASGSLWLASLPHDPLLALAAKAVVVSETVLAAVVLAVVAGSLRSPGAPTGAELAAIACSALLSTAVVVTLALHASVSRPHRADLRGRRDAVAPPGALALASVRLAVPTAVVSVLLGAAGATDRAWMPLLVTVPLLALCGCSLSRTARRWADPVHRARVVHVVATG